MSDEEAQEEGGDGKKKEKKKKEKAPPKEEEKKEESETDSFSRSIMDYIMPAKEMVRKMTSRRKYVIISDSTDPDYLDDLEEKFVLKADILWEEMYHFNLQGNLQRDRITRYLQKSTNHLEFPYIFVHEEYFESLDKFMQLAEKDALHNKVHGFGRGLDIQIGGKIPYAVSGMSQLWAEGMAGLRRSAEKRGIIEIDTRSDKEKEKEKKKKLAEKVKKQKQKEREAKKARIKRKLVWKARKKAAIAMVAKVGITIPQEDKKTKARRRKKKKAAKVAKEREKREKEKAKKEETEGK